ncbi:Oidioi.mRNA.OKI2018_I69.chr1.g1672.t1.cds [Oikopleura dioica]|uniref:Oidioi.mRNA.OKI2018_I69.chr1.g1672.t1.cds n=1 Tax=Oikopleura dioica TaxID=34765 RepID=A0ABN7SNM0_OIKDI|nr:Oidioi.mRNA.OKI2018_I69.chr1.g1672.t1.cds [Oikopleura dioica]
MRVLSILLFFLAADAKRKKRGRVKGGTKVNSATKYPTYVALVKKNFFPFCGGSILDETTILTAAHCLPSTDHIIVFGTNKRGSTLSSSEKRTNTVGIKSVNIIGNIIAGKNTWNNDWAIVKLAKPLQFGPTVAKAELGTWKEFEQYVLKGNDKCTVIGNGRTDGQYSGYERRQSQLRKTKTFCRGIRSAPAMRHCMNLGGKNCFVFKNTERVLVGSGDSGGPMFCKGDGGKMKVFGVASWATNGPASDLQKGFMGYAPVFSPEAQKHLGQWNPQNRPPNANTFQGFDKMMEYYFFKKELPDWAKGSASSSGSSSSGYSTGSYQSGRSSSTGSSYQSQNSRSQGTTGGKLPRCSYCPPRNKPLQAPKRSQYSQPQYKPPPSYARNPPSRSPYSGSSSSNNRYPSRKPVYNSRNSGYTGNSRSYNSGSPSGSSYQNQYSKYSPRKPSYNPPKSGYGSRNSGNSGSPSSNARPNYQNRISGRYRPGG